MEKLLEDSRHSGKRQAAPFSKGDPAEETKRPGHPHAAPRAPLGANPPTYFVLSEHGAAGETINS